MFIIEKLRASTTNVKLPCTCFPHDFRALHNDFGILTTFKYYFYHFLSMLNFQIQYFFTLAVLSFRLATSKYQLNALVFYF